MLKERGERSRIVKAALRAYLFPPEPQDEIAVVKLYQYGTGNSSNSERFCEGLFRVYVSSE